MKKNVLAIVAGYISSSHLDLELPLDALKSDGRIDYKLILEVEFQESYLANVDVVIMHRCTTLLSVRILQAIRSHNVPVLYQSDDNFFCVPLDFEVGKAHRDPVNVWALKEIIKGVDLVRVFSSVFAKRCQKYTDSVQLIKPYLLDFDKPQAEDESTLKPVSIVYATSRSEDPLQDIFLTALERILEKYQDKVHLFFMGTRPKHAFKKRDNVSYIPYQPSYASYMKEFLSRRFDIGLAPMGDSEFFNSKTNNKYREYGGCGVAGVYSNVPLYSSCVSNGVSGILVNNDEDSWFKGVESLILNEDMRRKIQQNSANDVRENYSFEGYVDGLYRDLAAASVKIRKPLHIPNISFAVRRDSSWKGVPERAFVICNTKTFISRFWSRTYSLGNADCILYFSESYAEVCTMADAIKSDQTLRVITNSEDVHRLVKSELINGKNNFDVSLVRIESNIGYLADISENIYIDVFDSVCSHLSHLGDVNLLAAYAPNKFETFLRTNKSLSFVRRAVRKIRRLIKG